MIFTLGLAISVLYLLMVVISGIAFFGSRMRTKAVSVVIMPACAVLATGSTAMEIAISSATARWNDEQIIVSLRMR